MAKNDKTNVMRVLEQHKIPYEGHNYLDSGAVGGTEVAAALNEDPEVVFKTLVTVGKTGNHYVFPRAGREGTESQKGSGSRWREKY